MADNIPYPLRARSSARGGGQTAKRIEQRHSVGFVSVRFVYCEGLAPIPFASPTIGRRIEALRQVHEAGIHTWVFIAPMLLMNPRRLVEQIQPHIDHAMVDPLNYRDQVAALFRRHGWEYALSLKA